MDEELVCETCGRYFLSTKEAGEHSREKHHYTFKLKGTNLSLAFLGEK
jgi:hypothetical protein